MKGLRERGHTATLVTQPDSPLAEKAAAEGIAVETIRMRGEWDLAAAWKLIWLTRRLKPDFVHAHDGHAVSMAGLAAAWGGGARAICTRRVDFAINSARKYARMTRVICISEAIKLVCIAGGIPEEKLQVVKSGIDLSRVIDAKADVNALRSEFAPEKKKPLLLLNVASLTDHKGQTYLLDAMPTVVARLPQVQLVIVGTGELERELKHKVNILALENDVVFAGFREDVPALLKACDAFVMSSHLEGLCTSVMDAMAAGKAVVATSAGGIPELVEDGKTGQLVPPCEPDALAEKLLAVLLDRKQREHLGRNGAAKATREFSYSLMVEGTLAVYQDILKQ